MKATRLTRTVVLASCLVIVGAVSAVSAQKGKGAAGASTLQPGGESGAKASRLEILTKTFTLDAEQVKQFRTAFDEGQKNAVPIKLALVQAHTAIGTAIQDAKGQSEIDAAVADYAAQSAAMTTVEVKTLAAALKSLRPEQMDNQRAMTTALGLLHGMFLGKWDSVPDGKTY